MSDTSDHRSRQEQVAANFIGFLPFAKMSHPSVPELSCHTVRGFCPRGCNG